MKSNGKTIKKMVSEFSSFKVELFTKEILKKTKWMEQGVTITKMGMSILEAGF